MKYAIVNGERKEPTKLARGECPACGSEMIARICKKKIDHWAHKSTLNCNRWWENETLWHRDWKTCFGAPWQEVMHRDINTNEVHIADVTTPYGWTIEFQHSRIDDEERNARNKFYKKIAWVVDGVRRKTDIDQLSELLAGGIKLRTEHTTYAINPRHNNRLLSEWHNSDSLVFFDYRQVDQSGSRVLWLILPTLEPKDAAVPSFVNDMFIQAFPARMFVESHINGLFDKFFDREIYKYVIDYSKELYNIRRRYKMESFPDPKFSWLSGG